MQRIVFRTGEERHVRLLIHATNNEPFTIRAARYELMVNGKTEDSGSCIVDEHLIDCRIAPKQKNGAYRLMITYEIADEVLVEEISVSVI